LGLRAEAVYLRLIGECIMDFLLVIIEHVSLAVTAEAAMSEN